jgi:hypothetical protein
MRSQLYMPLNKNRRRQFTSALARDSRSLKIFWLEKNFSVNFSAFKDYFPRHSA